MVAVRINGEESAISGGSLPTISDLVELVKISMDPEHMITAIRIDGRELEDNDWRTSPHTFGTAILEIETGSPTDYVVERIMLAPSIVRNIYVEFRDARKCFQNGDSANGNRSMMSAVQSLRAFFEWYGSLMELMSDVDKEKFNIIPQVEGISAICKRLCQQQLYQSWWALGESIEKELEPALDKLEDNFLGMRKTLNPQ